MRITCQHGYYKFYPQTIGEVEIWRRDRGIDLVKCRDYMTFKECAEFPDYSFTGWILGNSIAKVNYAGEPWEVMEKNGLAWTPLLGVTEKILNTNLLTAVKGACIYTADLPLCGHLVDLRPITGFVGFWFMDYNRFQIERFEYAGF